jgi:hypothetical protein
MTEIKSSDSFGWELYGDWYRLLVNGRRTALGVCVIRPDEARQALSTQEDLKMAMIDAARQMLGEGLLIYLE